MKRGSLKVPCLRFYAGTTSGAYGHRKGREIDVTIALSELKKRGGIVHLEFRRFFRRAEGRILRDENRPEMFWIDVNGENGRYYAVEAKNALNLLGDRLYRQVGLKEPLKPISRYLPAID